MACTLELAKIDHVLYREPDLGGFPTALATGTVMQDQRKHFARWKLL